MFLKCYHYLHLMAEFKVKCSYQIANADSNLDIKKKTPNTSEPKNY
jgi:hypothetical protein